MEQIHTYSHTDAHKLKHTQMPCGQKAAAGGEEVILEAEPDAAELRFGNMSDHKILNHSFSALSFSLLYVRLIISVPDPLLLSSLHFCLYL